MFRALSQNGRLFGKCFCDYVVLFFCFHRWVAGKGREKCISNGGCIIIDNYYYYNDDDEDEYSDGGRKRRATSIEHCLHSIKQIGSAPLLVSQFHAWTRKCRCSYHYIISAVMEEHERKRDGTIDGACTVNVLCVDRTVTAVFHGGEETFLNAKDSKVSIIEIQLLRYNEWILFKRKFTSRLQKIT